MLPASPPPEQAVNPMRSYYAARTTRAPPERGPLPARARVIVVEVVDARALLIEVLEKRCPGAAALLDTTSFTALARRVGRGAVTLAPDERDRLAPLELDGREITLDELARVAWLLAAEPDALARCYDEGDNRERQAVLRALPLRLDAKQHLALAIESTRTHVLPIFEAIACENPYPARYFPDLNFNQLALKAAFLGIELRRIAGLERRRSAELERMARDYAAEREAAGRPVPADLDLLFLRPKEAR